jgi:hypothetical protein
MLVAVCLTLLFMSGMLEEKPVVVFAIAPGTVRSSTVAYCTTLASVEPFPFGYKLAVPPKLLVVAGTVALGGLYGFTGADYTMSVSVLILPFGREPAVAAQLLVMASTVATGFVCLLTTGGLASR